MSDSEQTASQDPPQPTEQVPQEISGSPGQPEASGESPPVEQGGSEEELSDVDEEQFNEELLDDEVYQLSSHRKKSEGPKRVKERRRPPKKQSGDEETDVPSGRRTPVTSPTKRRRQTAKSSAGGEEKEDEEYQEIDDSTRRRRELESRIDAALKPTTKRKKVSGDDLEQMQDDAIAALRDKMRLAAVEDAECIKAGKPALNKIRMLPEVTSILRKESLADSILDGNLLESARMWLEPLPDASLPSYEIQREIFSALESLPIKTIHLRESGLGRVVLFYQKSKRPHAHIKRTADRLIGDWTRPIMGRSDNYRDKMVRTATFNPRELATSASSSSQPRKPEALTSYEESARRRNRAAIPTARGVTYDVAPMNTVASSIAQAGKHAAASGDSQLKRMKTKLMNSSKSQRSRKSNVSVEGRGLN